MENADKACKNVDRIFICMYVVSEGLIVHCNTYTCICLLCYKDKAGQIYIYVN